MRQDPISKRVELILAIQAHKELMTFRNQHVKRPAANKEPAKPQAKATPRG